ncbi:MAG: hypothetical protein V1723_03710 [Candidatus Uhrbacteria bacterium]
MNGLFRSCANKYAHASSDAHEIILTQVVVASTRKGVSYMAKKKKAAKKKVKKGGKKRRL